MPDPSNDCIFCGIVRGEIETELIAENASAVAFRDLHPQAPTHVLIVPREHYGALQDLGDDAAPVSGQLVSLALLVARQEGLLESGYRVLTNDGPDAGQTIPHLHFHLLGGRPLREGLG